jgi:photosystem II stability/assembly factor-like uncharacterized protein
MHWRSVTAWQQVCRRRVQAIIAGLLLAVCCAALALLPQGAAATTCIWSPQMSGTMQPFNGVTFVDNATGWAVGLGVYHTSDGGATWVAQPGGPGNLNAVSFVDRDYGWAVGQGAEILHTTDGGASWQAQVSDAIYPFFDVFFINRDVGWIVGFKDVLHTIDGGATWTAQRPLWPYSTTETVAFADARVGWAAGPAGIMRTTNGGATWIQSWNTSGMIFDLSFPDARNGWAVGVEGQIYHTSDGGENWTRQESGVSGIIYGVSFIDAQHGWASCAGTILRTDDGGQTWIAEASGTQDALFGVDAVDSAHAWAVGYGGTILNWHATAWDAPTIAISGAGSGWQAPPVRLVASASVDPALSLTHLEASSDDGATWAEVPGSGTTRELVVTAGGETLVTLRAIDSRGTEATSSTTVRIDGTCPTSRPASQTRTRTRITVTGKVPVRVTASDAEPGSGVAAVAVKIVARSGKVVGRSLLQWVGGETTRMVAVNVPLRLRAGTYAILASATDGAGNVQSLPGRAVLRVRQVR